MKKVILAIDVNNSAGRSVLGGIFKFISSHPTWSIHLFSCLEHLSDDVVRNAESNGFDGFITNYLPDDKTTQALFQTSLPISLVCINSPLLQKRKLATTFVDHRNDIIGQLGAQRFLQLGKFKSYAFVSHPENLPWSRERERGFVDKLRRHGVKASVLREANIQEAIIRLPKPAAVMAAWDYKAIEILEFARVSNIAVPEQLAVIGVDADPILCNFTRPPLSSVEPNFERVGYCAAAALDAMIGGRKTKGTNIVLCRPKGLVERASTRSLPPSLALIQRAMEIINRDAVHGLSVQDLALRLGVSKQLLALRFRQCEKCSVRDMILNMKLSRVKEMLAKTQTDLAAIAHECGFGSANRLSHIFKQRFDQTPGQFARRSRSISPKRR